MKKPKLLSAEQWRVLREIHACEPMTRARLLVWGWDDREIGRARTKQTHAEELKVERHRLRMMLAVGHDLAELTAKNAEVIVALTRLKDEDVAMLPDDDSDPEADWIAFCASHGVEP